MMTNTKRAQFRTAAIGAVVAGLSLANWYQTPSKALVWFAGLATIAVVTVVVMSLTNRRSQSDTQKRFLAMCAMLAGLLLAVPLVIALARSTGFADAAWMDRVPGVAMGLVLVFIGNELPKIFGQPHHRATVQKRTQSARRVTGWAFALAGLLGVAVWAFAPISQAEVIATLIYASALILTLTSWVWFARSPDRAH